jgi:hypothetical protein
MPVKTRLRSFGICRLQSIAAALGIDPHLRWKELVEAIAAFPDDEAQARLSPEDWADICPRPNPGRERITARRAPDGGGSKSHIQVLLRISPVDYDRLKMLVDDSVGATAAYHARCAMRAYLDRHVPVPKRVRRTKKGAIAS